MNVQTVVMYLGKINNRELAQQIRVDLVAGRGLAGARLGCQRLNAHFEHERSDVTPSRMDALARQLVAQHPCAHEGMLQVRLVELAHERQIGRADGPGR